MQSWLFEQLFESIHQNWGPDTSVIYFCYYILVNTLYRAGLVTGQVTISQWVEQLYIYMLLTRRPFRQLFKFFFILNNSFIYFVMLQKNLSWLNELKTIAFLLSKNILLPEISYCLKYLITWNILLPEIPYCLKYL